MPPSVGAELAPLSPPSVFGTSRGRRRRQAIVRFWALFVTRWLFAPPRCRPACAPTWYRCGIDLRSCTCNINLILDLGFVCNTLALDLLPLPESMRKFLSSLPPTLVHYIFLNSHLTRIFSSRIHIFKVSGAYFIFNIN